MFFSSAGVRLSTHGEQNMQRLARQANGMCGKLDRVAFVVAESFRASRDAAELIDVEYEVLPAVARADDALLEGVVRHGIGPSNLYLLHRIRKSALQSMPRSHTRPTLAGLNARSPQRRISARASGAKPSLASSRMRGAPAGAFCFPPGPTQRPEIAGRGNFAGRLQQPIATTRRPM
jgi:hypothetical protein